MKVVIDTNVLLSAAFRDRLPERVVLWWGLHAASMHGIKRGCGPASNRCLEYGSTISPLPSEGDPG